MPFDILVVGEINPDLILTGDVKPKFGQVEKLVDLSTLAIDSSFAILRAVQRGLVCMSHLSVYAGMMFSAA